MPAVFLTNAQLERVRDRAGNAEDDDLLGALDPVDEGDVLVMTPQTVREHLDALEDAPDEEIEKHFNDEVVYEAWHRACAYVQEQLGGTE